MSTLDWSIVGVYMCGLVGLSFYLSRGQSDHHDYYLGGRNLSWWSVGLSTMATQLSAISFISAPAFVGLREGGGLKWLSYEFAVPLAMIFLISVIIPPLYKSGVVSIYGYLEHRFGPSTRLIISGVFQFSRAFATGITVYAVALVLSEMLDVAIWINILITAVVAIVYDFLGGMKAVVISDVIQMGVLLLGIFVCIVFAVDLVGGWNVFLANVDPSRLQAVDFGGIGIGDGAEFGFWPMVIGGFFLYASYYGCDQSQAQRTLSTPSIRAARTALVLNGVARYPIVLLYSIMGLVIGTFAVASPDFMESMAGGKTDSMVPVFIVDYLPSGMVGLLVASILAAAMSSLDSALNSLSAASVEDLIARGRKEPLSTRSHLIYSKILTVFWGIVCMVLAFAAGNIAPTIIEAINKVGSLFYGPILATFALAILTRGTNTLGVNAGIFAGVLVNLFLWLLASESVFWFWWNATGAVTTLVVAVIVSRISGETASPTVPDLGDVGIQPRTTAVLAVYFVTIVTLSMSLALLG